MSDYIASILVVDDEEICSSILQTILIGAGYRVIIRENGEDAIQYAMKHEPDLILLDISLPDINGYEVCRQIRDSKNNMLIPIIFITGLGEQSVLENSAKIGIGIDFILKPIQAEILLARVANILDVVQSRKELAIHNERLKQEISEQDNLAAVAKQCSYSVFIVDLLGTIIYANPAGGESSGYSQDDLMGRKMQDLTNVKKDDVHFQDLMNHIFIGEDWHGTIQSYKKDGSSYLEVVELLPIKGAEDTINGHVLIKRDITERRRLETIARSVNLMDNVGFVFSGIRHELGNPVNSLKMTLSVLSKKINEFSPEVIADFLERSQQEISRIEYLLTSLRSFSMFENPVPTTVNLPLFLAKLMDMHRKNFESARVTIIHEVDKDAEEVFVDSRALVQVMLNLLTNAVNALEGIKEPMIRICVFRKSRSLVCLSLQDNGCGISEKNQEKLFNPFFTTRAEGTGLGLVIVKKMLSEMDCSIHVTSRKGEGTTFSVLIPSMTEVI